MTKHRVNDHEWHDIDYAELPGWAKHRIKTLQRKQLVGRHFRYRAVSSTQGFMCYQRRLRYHIRIHTRATFQFKQNKLRERVVTNLGKKPRIRLNFQGILRSKFGVSKRGKLRSHGRGFISWTALPIFSFMAASIAIAVYSYANLEEFGRPVGIGIIATATIVALWNASKLRQLWQYRPWNLGVSKVLLAAVIVGLLGSTTAAYSDVEPFSTAKSNITEWFSSTGGTVAGWFQEKPISEVESEVLALVNVERANRSIPQLQWDENLHEIAREHSQAMAARGSMFHSSVSAPYAENCYWSGSTTYNTSARDIVTSWMGSDKHRTWLLCPNLKHIGVGLVKSDKGLWASWTFWRSETAYSDWWYSDGGTPPSWWY